MNWLLRLFPEFRALELDLTDCRAALDELSQEKLLLQDRLDSAIADRDHLWTVMQTALDNERNAMRMQINHAVQRSGGGIPYPDSHSLPPNVVRPASDPGPVGRRGRILPSEAVNQRTNQAIKEMVADMDNRIKGGN